MFGGAPAAAIRLKVPLLDGIDVTPFGVQHEVRRPLGVEVSITGAVRGKLPV